mmetsp:Transcript_43365/g.87428  ORF Transcript_43365/g.87428 Transcript_43365/m.87428 type:complete len:310 (-) Transcript_43365:209-1138(-)|eukprot:CAMPEP_0113818414 /NCGR_PEP_ID=MMETSP0328-20130328/228_1 /TAXON_ID=39455 /ORGANISM="Alexandrium minutum" /LENGTH=309 /DNA_ID=CAMNT_0000786349 /DNA_START=151 /DNA_END=1080 /DNA_ORIENTATION=- /assembly_acc=CAM_ASM_000350
MTFGQLPRVAPGVARDPQELAQVPHGVLCHVELEEPLFGDPLLALRPEVVVFLLREVTAHAAVVVLEDPSLVEGVLQEVELRAGVVPHRDAAVHAVEHLVARISVVEGQHAGVVGEGVHAQMADDVHEPLETCLLFEVRARLAPLLVAPPVQHDDLCVRADLVDMPEDVVDVVEGESLDVAHGEAAGQPLMYLRPTLYHLLVGEPPLRPSAHEVADLVGGRADRTQALPREHSSSLLGILPVGVREGGPHVAQEVFALPRVRVELAQGARHLRGARPRRRVHEHLDAGDVFADEVAPAIETDRLVCPIP